MLMPVGKYEAAHDSESMDEFAVPQESEKGLRDQHQIIERVFGVNLNILGVLNQHPLSLQSIEHQQMWLQLRGEKKSILKAKDYIKGLCNPEVTEDFKYQRDMHCIFVGANGLFLDCLIRATSACVTPLTPGLISISGLVEGVVMAQSRIHAFLDICTSRPEDQQVNIKRSFKDLVEQNNDHHALDLLILPTSVKEQLLILVEEDKEWRRKQPMAHQETGTLVSEKAMSSHDLFPAPDFQNHLRPERPTTSPPIGINKLKHKVLRQRASDPHALVTKNEWNEDRQPMHVTGLNNTERLVLEVNADHDCTYPMEAPRFNSMTPVGSVDDNENEFQQISGLLDTIMGKDDGGPGSQPNFSLGTETEFNMLLDFFKTMGYQESVVLKVLSENGIQEPSRILHKVNMEQSNHDHSTRPITTQEMSHNSNDDDDDETYVLGVMKEAAMNCGYSPSEIVDIGDGSVAGLLRKLNEKNNSGDNLVPPEIKETDLQIQQTFCQSKPEPNTSVLDEGMYSIVRHKVTKANHPVEDVFHGGSQQNLESMESTVNKAAKEELNVPVVTGAQRFIEAMQTPFQLNLRNEKGNDRLRHIIIDGSNVAKIHGLHRFFSCRGIALAVQYFWDRGHRNITVFVPQWRMKKDSKSKEQHFLTELNDLGLLSFTPSRTIEGKRITSYDDRFMLKLAERTDGVIVTNDYLRDIFAESQAWQSIIKDRVLQFTFVGDIFMVPDDPLGRNGPPLDQFLTKSMAPKPKSKGHSFAGSRVPHSPPKPSSQTEVLHLRDRKPIVHKAKEKTGIRSHKDTERLRYDLLSIFPQQETKVDFVLQREPFQNDLNKLSELIINLKF